MFTMMLLVCASFYSPPLFFFNGARFCRGFGCDGGSRVMQKGQRVQSDYAPRAPSGTNRLFDNVFSFVVVRVRALDGSILTLPPQTGRPKRLRLQRNAKPNRAVLKIASRVVPLLLSLLPPLHFSSARGCTDASRTEPSAACSTNLAP